MVKPRISEVYFILALFSVGYAQASDPCIANNFVYEGKIAGTYKAITSFKPSWIPPESEWKASPEMRCLFPFQQVETETDIDAFRKACLSGRRGYPHAYGQASKEGFEVALKKLRRAKTLADLCTGSVPKSSIHSGSEKNLPQFLPSKATTIDSTEKHSVPSP